MAEIIEEYKLAACTYCNKPTKYTGTRMCDNCWELMNRMGVDLEATKKILEELESAVRLRSALEKGGDTANKV